MPVEGRMTSNPLQYYVCLKHRDTLSSELSKMKRPAWARKSESRRPPLPSLRYASPPKRPDVRANEHRNLAPFGQHPELETTS